MGLTSVTINADSSPTFQSEAYTGYIQNLSIGTATGQIISENNTIKSYTLPFGQFFAFKNLVIQKINNGPVPVEFTFGSNGTVPESPSTGGMNINNTINIQGTITGNVNVSNTLNIQGTISGSVIVSNTLNIQGTINGSVNVSNVVNIQGTINGNVNISNTVDIQGTISGSVNIGNTVNIQGTISGSVDISNTVSITGSVSGTVDIGNTVNILGTISGSVDISNTVSITGSVSGTVDIGNTVNILGTISGNVNVSNTIDIQGTISGSVTISNNVNIEGVINTVNININGQALGLSTYNNNTTGYIYLATPSADISGIDDAYSITINTGPEGAKLLKCNIAAQSTSIVNILQYIGITGSAPYMQSWSDPYYRTSYETFYLAEGQSILYDLNGIQFMVMNPNATATTTLNNSSLGINQYTYTTPIYLPPNTSITITFGQFANFSTSTALAAYITIYYEGDITFSGQTGGGGGGTIH